MTASVRRRHRGTQPHRQAQAIVDQALADGRTPAYIAAAVPLAPAEAWLTHNGWTLTDNGWTRDGHRTVSRHSAIVITVHEQARNR